MRGIPDEIEKMADTLQDQTERLEVMSSETIKGVISQVMIQDLLIQI
jgi:hypothetical protein